MKPNRHVYPGTLRNMRAKFNRTQRHLNASSRVDKALGDSSPAAGAAQQKERENEQPGNSTNTREAELDLCCLAYLYAERHYKGPATHAPLLQHVALRSRSGA